MVDAEPGEGQEVGFRDGVFGAGEAPGPPASGSPWGACRRWPVATDASHGATGLTPRLPGCTATAATSWPRRTARIGDWICSRPHRLVSSTLGTWWRTSRATGGASWCELESALLPSQHPWSSGAWQFWGGAEVHEAAVPAPQQVRGRGRLAGGGPGVGCPSLTLPCPASDFQGRTSPSPPPASSSFLGSCLLYSTPSPVMLYFSLGPASPLPASVSSFPSSGPLSRCLPPALLSVLLLPPPPRPPTIGGCNLGSAGCPGLWHRGWGQQQRWGRGWQEAAAAAAGPAGATWLGRQGCWEGARGGQVHRQRPRPWSGHLFPHRPTLYSPLPAPPSPSVCQAHRPRGRPLTPRPQPVFTCPQPGHQTPAPQRLLDADRCPMGPWSSRDLLEPKPRPQCWPRPGPSPVPLHLTDPPRRPRPLWQHL